MNTEAHKQALNCAGRQTDGRSNITWIDDADHRSSLTSDIKTAA